MKRKFNVGDYVRYTGNLIPSLNKRLLEKGRYKIVAVPDIKKWGEFFYLVEQYGLEKTPCMGQGRNCTVYNQCRSGQGCFAESQLEKVSKLEGMVGSGLP